ncbi:MAG TPA: dicarboxylate/amino acid:cation symporter [Methanocorpusculum sp.]|nr:dicarboxylate/amino acid:cation symporter [Methanocorpusculum sp.]
MATSRTFRLSAESVSEISLLTAQTLKEEKINAYDAERLNDAVRTVLGRWLEGLGENAECVFRSGTKLRRQYITLTAPGQKVNPFGGEGDCVLSGGNSVQTLLANMGLVPSYHYTNGENQITIMPKRTKKNPLIFLGIAIFFGVVVGLLCHLLPDQMRLDFGTIIVTPLFNTLIGILVAAALPMMFLSLVWGIYSIGDTATLGRIGKKVIARYFGRIYFTLFICALVSLPFFPIAVSGDMSGTTEFVSIWNMLLGIAPDNLFTPFTSGNTLQLIFLAIVFGLAMLTLNKKIPSIVQLVSQANSIIQLVMEWITAFLPFLVFISVLNLMLSDTLNNIGEFAILFVILLLSVIANLILMGGEVTIFQKLSPKTLIRKFAPSFLVALSTASSAATFSTNMHCCEKRLGIAKRLVNFGVPLGTAFSRPGHAVTFFCVCLFMANYFGITITISWIVIAIISSGLLALAVPPVPGGGIACYSILFLQLGLPVEAIGIAVVLEILLDFISTALNMVAVPVDLVHVADKLEMVDHDVLKKE